MDNDIMELDYLRYLEASIEEQTSLENFVNKCVGINESTSINEQLQVFTEGVVDTMRTNWQKFKVWVKKVWARFLEKLANTFSNPQGYLEQYKDIILNKKVKDNYEVTIPDHSVGVKRILGGETIPKIQANTIYSFCKSVTASHSETGDNGQVDAEKFKEYVNNNIENMPTIKAVHELFKKADADLGDNNQAESALKQYFLGGEAIRMKTNDARLNMADMYEFCHDNDKIRANIENEQHNFETNCDTIINDFEKFLKDGYAEAKKAQTEQPKNNEPKPTTGDKNASEEAEKVAKEIEKDKGTNTPGNPGTQPPAANPGVKPTGGESAMLTEADKSLQRVETGSTSSNSTSGSNTGSTRTNAVNASVNSTMSGKYDDKENYQSGGNVAGKEMAASIKNIDAFATGLKNEFNNFKTTTALVFKAKAGAALEIFTDYMSLIRAHVQDYVGNTKNVADNKATDRQTNYNNNPQPQGGGSNS